MQAGAAAVGAGAALTLLVAVAEAVGVGGVVVPREADQGAVRSLKLGPLPPRVGVLVHPGDPLRAVGALILWLLALRMGPGHQRPLGRPVAFPSWGSDDA